MSQERGRREKSHRFSRDFRRFRDHFSDSGCPQNRRKALPERVFAEFLGFPQSPHPLLRLLRLLFFFLSFFPLPPRTENSVCRFAGLQRGGKKCGFALDWWVIKFRLVVDGTPSSVAYGAKLLAVFFPLEGEGYCTDLFRFYFQFLIYRYPKMLTSKSL